MKKFLMKIKTGIKRILKIFSDLPRKKKIIFSVITGVVSLLLVVAITVTATVNLYLNKINYGDVSEVATATPEAMKELDEQENISFDIVDSKEISDSDSASASDSVKKIIRIICLVRTDCLSEMKKWARMCRQRRIKTLRKISATAMFGTATMFIIF